MSKTKFTNFKQGLFYKREGDGVFFKMDKEVGRDPKYYTLNENSVWTETQDLKLTDDFIMERSNPGKESLVQMFDKYRSGDAETQSVYLHRLLQTMASRLDNL